MSYMYTIYHTYKYVIYIYVTYVCNMLYITILKNKIIKNFSFYIFFAHIHKFYIQL